MMRKICLIVLLAFFLPACATVNKGGADHFRVDSAPQGATVTTTLETRESKKRRMRDPAREPQYVGCRPTPCSIKMSRHSKFIATIEMDGYEPAEIFVDSSTRQGSFAGSAIMTTGTVTGVAVMGAATAAAMQAFAAQFGAVLASTTVNIATYGLLNIPPSSFAVTTTSTSSAAASAVPPALAVSGGMLLVDAASGANKKLFPNPVVMGLAPEGTQVLVDPLAILYRKVHEGKISVEILCQVGKRKDGRLEACQEAKAKLLEDEKVFRDFKREYYAALKADAKAAKKAKREAWLKSQEEGENPPDVEADDTSPTSE